MLIRDYRDGDYAALLALWRETDLPVKSQGRDAREELERQIGTANVFILVAELNGEVVGTVLGSHDARKGWLNRLAVAEKWRRAPVGVAVALIEEAERRFRTLGLEIFCCFIETQNEGSMRLMSRMGYRPFENVVYYTKRLRPDI